ncbi:restriction endonuclease subunit S [Asanoa sp. NPDC049518]|uniref:restriction endonuclease subunit S n=1 Tax=unclassified Asanoa TaxID=2685164 RepID=UPI0034380320
MRANTLFELRYGRALVEAARRPGRIPVYGTNGRCGSHDTPLFKGPGLVLGRKGQGPLGVEWVNGDFWVIDTAYALEPITNDVDLKFSYYLIKHVGLNHLKDGTSNPSLGRDTFASQLFPLPPIEEQQRIAKTLGALDDKIASNRRAISLEFGLASSQLSTGTKALRVGDVATMKKGLSYKGAGLDDGSATNALPMLNLANFTTTGQLNAEGTKYYAGDFKPAHRLREFELLVANTDLTQSREILGRGFLVPPAFAGSIHTHHTSVVRFTGSPWMAAFLWAQLQSPEFRERAEGFATGTTVTALPVEALLDFTFRVPANPERLFEQVSTLIRHAWQLEGQNNRLVAIREALLPELLSGRIRATGGR